MHHLTLNIPDIMVKLFRGSFECKEASDDVEDWPWAVFRVRDHDDTAWDNHGEVTVRMCFYIPRSFGKAPRNIAAKMNSGYKAWEHMYHFYMVLPGQLWGVLDDELFEHYCKLVAGARFTLMLETPVALRSLAHMLLTECLSRPSLVFLQWVLETFIGNLTCEIGSDSCPYTNLAVRATRRAQEAALYAMFPQLVKPEGLPKDAVVLGDDYILLAYGRDECAWLLPEHGREVDALRSYLDANQVDVPAEWQPGVWKWAHLQLPNGQIAHTAFGECKCEARGLPLRRAHMVKVCVYAASFPCMLTILTFLYFFRINNTRADGKKETMVLAMVLDFTPVDRALAKKMHGVLMVCYSQPDQAPRVVDVKDILSVVAIMPLPARPFEADQPDTAQLYVNRYYVGEKIGCDMAWIGCSDNPREEEEDGEEV
ncbi:hypothetical protein OH76DRAFT_1457658 [Lentinus brumalis]|uniref:Uncharacterized protein n=1 Tax=Lentinus brumalis TaxID=2498619 RepID=A0A371CZ05_9APHY|nr:hypothetical protein OH76DRAFT_1457658 [Polyporus brumalis]